MASYLDILDSIAKVIGGTAPDATNRPRWFSGVAAGDGTGIAGLNGCYSIPPDGAAQDPPIAVLIPDTGSYPGILVQGGQERIDNVRLIVVVPRNSPETQIPTLMSIADAVPSAFQAHMTAYSAANVMSVYPVRWRLLAGYNWSGEEHLALEYLLEVRRYAAVTYTL